MDAPAPERPGTVDSDLHYMEVNQLGPKLATGEISPVELVQSLLTRIDRLEPRLNAFISLDADRALGDARRLEGELQNGFIRGPLHGVPVAIKDNMATEGLVTTGGTRVLGHSTPDHDAIAVARLRTAGAIVFGKTNLPEFAIGPVDEFHFGPTRNPWDLDRYAGGSSMGAGAALAAGLVPAAVGTDTTGSIRHPAGWCGVVGLKPTYGLVPVRGTMPMARSLDHVGPMARSVHDVALLLDVLKGFDRDDPTSVASPVSSCLASAIGLPVRDLRVGVLPALRPSYDNDVADVFDGAVDALERALGCSVRDVDVPSWTAAAAAGGVIARCEAAAEYGHLLDDRPDDILPQLRDLLIAGQQTSGTDYIEARDTAEKFRIDMTRLFDEIDVLAVPAREHAAPRIDESGKRLDLGAEPMCAVPLNVSGVPALTVPAGFSEHGLPIGIQLVAAQWAETLLLRLGHAYQQITSWHVARPPLD